MSRIARLRRLLGRARRATPDDDPGATVDVEGENLLLISDLHLGEACKEHSRIEYLKRAADLDGYICDFLEYHAEHRPGGRPWRLILGGDLLDFLQVTMVPPGTTGEAAVFGLGTREEESVWKLRRLMERHREFFVFLAAFVGAGHRLEIIRGNHDEELFWPAVRAALVDGLIDLFFGDEGHPHETPEGFAARIRFHPWFYFERDQIYVEHGHRFDDFCVTPPQLAPLKPRAEDELTQPLSYLAIRYFANRQPGFRTHDKEHWGLREYAAYFRTIGLGAAAASMKRYGELMLRVARYYIEHGRFESDAAVEAHARYRAELAEAAGLDAATVDRLEALGARSIMGRALGLWTMMGMVEWSAMAAVLATVALTLGTAWGWAVDAAAVAAVGGLGLFSVKRLRARYPRDIKAKLDRAASEIGALLQVPVVALGHSHRPVRRRMLHDHRAFFVNTGSFLSHEHDAHQRGEPCRCPTTFVVMVRPELYARPVPRLKRWCTVLGRPEPFETPERSAQPASR